LFQMCPFDFQWSSLVALVSFTNKTDHYHITEIVLTVVLNTTTCNP
jgi:hypothetical protein